MSLLKEIDVLADLVEKEVAARERLAHERRADSIQIKPGVVVRYHPGQRGIVCERADTPDSGWVNDQVNVTVIKQLGPTDWWHVLLFSGGSIRAPGPLLTVERDATYEDFLVAVNMANTAGRKTLAATLPQFVEQVLTACKPS